MKAVPLASRVRDISEHVQRAHQAFEAGDAAGCGWRARTATEGMLLVLCALQGIEPPPTPASGSTLGTLRKALRHANALDRGLEDQVAHIQNIGNRAAHAQSHTHLTVDLEDARSMLPALDRTWAIFVQRLPPELRPPPRTDRAEPASAPRATTRLRTLAGLVVAITAPAVAFFAIVQALTWWPQPPAAAPQAVEVPVLDGATLDAMLSAEPRPEVPPLPVETHPLESARTAAFTGTPLGSQALAGLSCPELAQVRNGVWARRGYVFQTADARSMFEGTAGYVARPDASRREIERLFDDEDARTLTTLDEVMRSRGCACPQPGRRRPCPE